MTDGVKFRDLVVFARGGGWGSEVSLPDHESVAVIRGTDFGNVALGYVDKVPRRYEKVSKLRERTLRCGDIILEVSGGSSAKGQSTGRTLFVSKTILDQLGQPAIPASFCRVIRVDESVVDPQYAYYGLQDMYKSGRAATYENQSTGISNFQFERFLDAEKLRVPERREQELIRSLLGAFDDKIAANQRTVFIVSELLKAKYDEAIHGDTVTVPLGSVVDVFDGPHATPKKTTSGPWFLSISSLSGGRLVLRESAHLSDDDFQSWTRRAEPRPGDVLFSYETRLGEAALMPRDIRACLGRRMALMRPRDELVGSCTLLQAFLNDPFQETIRQRAIHGATVDRIPLTSLPEWPIDLPGSGTRQLEEGLSRFDDLASSSERQNETLEVLRDTLLPRLMSGEIQVREAERIVGDAT